VAAGELTGQLAGGRVPKPHHQVSACDGETGAVMRKGDRVHGSGLPEGRLLDGLSGCHLPESDDPVGGKAGGQELAVRRELYCADVHIVSGAEFSNPFAGDGIP
jgi:hypothetical protein